MPRKDQADVTMSRISAKVLSFDELQNLWRDLENREFTSEEEASMAKREIEVSHRRCLEYLRQGWLGLSDRQLWSSMLRGPGEFDEPRAAPM